MQLPQLTACHGGGGAWHPASAGHGSKWSGWGVATTRCSMRGLWSAQDHRVQLWQFRWWEQSKAGGQGLQMGQGPWSIEGYITARLGQKPAFHFRLQPPGGLCRERLCPSWS